MDPDCSIDCPRLERVERTLNATQTTLSTTQVSLARVEEQLKAHAERSVLMQGQLQEDVKTLIGRVEPLRESAWKQRGAASAFGAVFGFLASATVTVLARYWR
jgi:hypothetical protein